LPFCRVDDASPGRDLFYNCVVPVDPYKVLGVSRAAAADEIRQAYRALARKYHPDINKAEGAEDRFKEIGQAFSVLSDEKRRALYDEFGDEALSSQFDPREARRRDRPSSEQTARSAPARPSARCAAAPGDDSPDIVTPLEIDLATAIHGDELTVPSPLGGASLMVRVPAGAESGQQLRVRGRGRVGSRGGRPGDLYLEIVVLPHPFFRRDGRDLHLELPVTVNEAHQGATIEIPSLDGRLRLPVPAGSRGGERLRLRGKGISDGEGGRGDLYVHLCIRLPDRLDAAGRAIERMAGLYSEPVRRDLRL
jgi:curved DNA-binding protein